MMRPLDFPASAVSTYVRDIRPDCASHAQRTLTRAAWHHFGCPKRDMRISLRHGQRVTGHGSMKHAFRFMIYMHRHAAGHGSMMLLRMACFARAEMRSSRVLV